MRVEWTSDPKAFVRREWANLVGADPEATFFHTPRYLSLYWDQFSRGALRIAFVRDGRDLVGAAAFEIVDGTLMFLGGTEVTDYMGPVALPDARERAAKELAAAVASLDAWSTADLQGLVASGTWTSLLATSAEDVGLEVEVGDAGVAPFLALPDTYDAYLGRLSGKQRHEIRRKARRVAERLGAPRIADATPETLTEGLDRFVRWHRESEGAKGRFMVSGMELFFRRLAEEFVPDGTLRLSFLEAGGVPLAGTIGFRDRRRLLLYNSAYDHAHRSLAPGMVLVGELIRDAIAEGLDAFDFLQGDLEYKYRFGARPRRLVRLGLGRR